MDELAAVGVELLHMTPEHGLGVCGQLVEDSLGILHEAPDLFKAVMLHPLAEVWGLTQSAPRSCLEQLFSL